MVKNLEFLFRIFKGLPHLGLSLVGTRELEAKPKDMVSFNVSFLGVVANSQMATLLCTHDTLILPSVAKPWGLAVEQVLAVVCRFW
ncbi:MULTISPECIES: hypothetical protein [unclassified Helicobacter]|uniref:hypothetical protein n=1 Tax=Helicobacter TaxID=209 RepID=UPI001C853359|nr:MULTISPECIES: hypothetical protein [unclassified Helicobacter]